MLLYCADKAQHGHKAAVYSLHYLLAVVTGFNFNMCKQTCGSVRTCELYNHACNYTNLDGQHMKEHTVTTCTCTWSYSVGTLSTIVTILSCCRRSLRGGQPDLERSFLPTHTTVSTTATRLFRHSKLLHSPLTGSYFLFL